MMQKQTAPNNNGPIPSVSTRIHPNAGIEQKYARILKTAVLVMSDETQKEIAEALHKTAAPNVMAAMDAGITDEFVTRIKSLSRRFAAMFQKIAELHSKEMITETKRYTNARMAQTVSEVAAAVGAKNLPSIITAIPVSRAITAAPMPTNVIPFTISTKNLTDFEREQVKAMTVQNVGLIKSIPAQYFDKIQTAVTSAIVGGNETSQILKTVREIGYTTEKRAKFIALDQTLKANGTLTIASMKQAGFTKFKWNHSSSGQHPRREHVEMDGNVYEIDNPPIIDSKTGERGFPMQLINCHCFATPVFEGFKPNAT